MNISTMNSIQHSCQYQVITDDTVHNKTSFHVKKHAQQLAVIFAAILTIAPSARAGLPSDMEVFNGMEEVADADLGQMRGKFASDNQVLYFGVEMISQWQTSAGNVVTAGANLNIDFKGGSTPTVQYVPTVTIVQGNGNAPVSNVANVSGGAGLSNVNGVSQSIQVAGQSNHIRNDVDMQVQMYSAMQGGGTVGSAVQGNVGTVAQTASDGTVATVTLANNSVGLSVIVPGQGEVIQQIRNQGLMQAVRIGGDLNLIHNQITMNIGLNSQTGLNNVGISTALQSLKGIPQL